MATSLPLEVSVRLAALDARFATMRPDALDACEATELKDSPAKHANFLAARRVRQVYPHATRASGTCTSLRIGVW